MNPKPEYDKDGRIRGWTFRLTDPVTKERTHKTIPIPEKRRAQFDFGAVRQRQDGFQDLAGRATRAVLSCAWAVRVADGGEQQVQIARHVGHRPDRRARVGADGLLLDRDHGREPEHEIDIGLRDLRDEPLREARQRLHVPPLAFGVDGVEREARLAGTRESGDDDELVARNLDRDVPEVVHASALHGDGRARGGISAFGSGRGALPRWVGAHEPITIARCMGCPARELPGAVNGAESAASGELVIEACL